ncbi:MAG: response regulator transcription factor [Paludibacteraceae bacterium]|nr:response regulator transcription factor [Prevotella sp.]MBQ8706302.1 response regulator transcription factor [Paludibacteraceae bacterium]MBQ8715564.1 response regulator transcription factor [Prevotella sp.]
MEQKRVLVVDDERDLCDILLFNLRAAGYQAEAAYSAEEVLPLRIADYDLLLLDVMMPGMSGFELAKHLKEDEKTRPIPIIFLTAKDTESDMLHGFSLGADDYVTKPFSVREVMARVKAVLNRSKSMIDEPTVYEGLVINVANKTVYIDGDPIALTRTEYELLLLLMEHRGQVFTRQQLLDKVWRQDVIVTERTVDVNIARLRKKLDRYAACLVSRTGYGYSFKETTNK